MKSMIVLALYLATCLLVVSGIRSFHSNQTISGSKTACKHHTWYYVNQNVEFKICLAQSDQYLKVDGNSITDLIKARSFLPTCRVMQLMLWMYSFFSETSTSHTGAKEYFVDVGANIGSCSMHLAALGYPVIAVEPVPEHIGIITGSMQMNPSFAVNLFRGGIAHEDKQIKATLSHQEFNWGNSQIKEAESGSGSGGGTEELHLYTLDTLIAHRKVALLKLDCEGCEYSALLGAKNSLSKVAMIKFEFFENNCKCSFHFFRSDAAMLALWYTDVSRCVYAILGCANFAFALLTHVLLYI